MKLNKVGNSNILVSETSLGCMSLDHASNNQSIINYALKMGINHFDTADLYQFGLNEEMLGKLLLHKRHDIIISSKVGNQFNPLTKEVKWNPSKQHIKSSLKDSLTRLKTDYLDIYLLHGGTIEDNSDETIEAFEELKKDGLIRSYGISSIRPNVINYFIENSNIDVVMMQYSLLDRRAEYNMLDKLHQNNISVFSRGSLAKGLLTNEIKSIDSFLNYDRDEFKQIHEVLLTEFSSPISSLAINYVLNHPAITSNVIGVSSLAQLTSNLKYLSDSRLSGDDYNKLKTLTKLINFTQHI